MHMTINDQFWQVCTVKDVPDPGGLGFEISEHGKKRDVVVIHWRNSWYAYLNRCPHTGVNLNWLPDQFFDIENELIQCSMHGALFRPESGMCVHGPCIGQSLKNLLCVVEDGQVYVGLVNIEEIDT